MEKSEFAKYSNRSLGLDWKELGEVDETSGDFRSALEEHNFLWEPPPPAWLFAVFFATAKLREISIRRQPTEISTPKISRHLDWFLFVTLTGKKHGCHSFSPDPKTCTTRPADFLSFSDS